MTQQLEADWTDYRRLEAGEIVRHGDECFQDGGGWDSPGTWVPAEHTIGRPAPDPRYPAHTLFRRKIEVDNG